jgi:hypothetical protein
MVVFRYIIVSTFQKGDNKDTTTTTTTTTNSNNNNNETFSVVKNYSDFKNICVIFLFFIAMIVQSRSLRIILKPSPRILK